MAANAGPAAKAPPEPAVAGIDAAKTAILESIASGAPMQVVLSEIALAIERLSPGAIASVILLSADGLRLRHGAAPNLPDAFCQAVDGLPIGPSVGSCGTALYTGEPVLVADIEASPLWREYRSLARTCGLRACWSVPVRSPSGAMAASFALYHREVRSAGPRDLALMTTFANLTAIAVERGHAIESLRESEQRFQAIAAATADVVWDWDLRTDTIWWRDDFEQTFGHAAASVATGSGWMGFIHPEDRRRVTDDIRATITARRPSWRAEFRFLHGDGRVLDVENRGGLVLDADGRPNRFVGGMSDITERKRQQHALRERIKELRCLYRVLELTSDPSRPAADICADIAHSLPASLLHEHLAVARVQCEGTEHVCGSWQSPAASLRVVISSAGAETGFVEVGYREAPPHPASQDDPFLPEERALVEAVAAHIARMLDSRRLATRLMQSERLGAVGELTGGVAHDFNNLLTVILGNTELLVDALADRPALARMAEVTHTAAERGADLIQRLLAFARRQTLASKPTQIDALIGGMGDMLARTLGGHVEMRITHAADLWPALIDSAQLENAVLNLCINARDAMPAGGRLTIELANVRLDGAYAGWNEDVTPGDYVLVAVSDTGTGMSAGVLARAFEPFYTTKETGRGSGLGLSMVYGFARQSRGHVKIYSEPGQGTTVKLYLPRATAGADAQADAERQPALPMGRESVLLVEDDDLVREHVAGQLRSLGYAVTAMRIGRDALEALRSDAPFDLLFTDVVMPGGLNGPQLAAHARRVRPDLPVLFTSGYTDNAIVHHGHLEPGVHLLNKPYRRSQLAEKVRQVLDGPLTAPK